MPSLADLQAAVHRALISGDGAALGSTLVGGRRPLDRFSIHQRHYQAGLLTTLLEKFPATGWLIGSDAVILAAQAFVTEHPPDRPCIAEYGASFPAFLAGRAAGATPPYLLPFAALEWYVGQVSIATSEPPITWTEIVAAGARALSGSVLGLQSGIRYMHADYAVDDLMKVYLAGSAPDQFTLANGEIWIEVRGARGDVQLSRLDASTFAFRTALVSGRTLADAAERAFMHDERFDLARALTNLVKEGLVTALTPAEGVEP